MGTGAWTVSGPSTLTTQFSSTTNPVAVFTPAGGVGSYILTWTISNAPCTSSTSTVTITVNANPSAVTITPSAPTICNGGSTTLVASGGTGSLTTLGTLGTATTATTASSTAAVLGPNPLQSYYGGAKQQMLIKAAELTALGITASTPINSIAFNLATVESRTLQNYVVKMQNTSLAAFASTTFVATGFTTVRTAANLTPVSGWNTISLTTPFTWNGTSNLLIEVNFSNSDTGGAGTNTAQYSTTTGFASSLFYVVDSATAAAVDAATTATFAAYTQRNNMQLGYTTSAPANFTWAASPSLNTTSGATVTASPTTTTTYTATSTINNCPTSKTVTVTVNTRPTAAITSGDGTVCNGSATTLSGTITATGAWTLTLSGNGGTVTGTGSGTWTKSVTATTSGTVYSIASLTDSTCASIAADLTGTATISFNARPTAAVTSATSTICSGSSGTISGTITASGAWSFTLNGGGGTVTGTGSGTWSQSVSPTSNTTYSIVSLSDSLCASIAANLTGTGTVNVSTGVGYGNTQFPATGTICPADSFTVYGQVYKAVVTEAAGQGAGIVAQLGYSTTNTDPSTWTNWQAAVFNTQSGNNDEYKSTLSGLSSGTTYYYAWRYAYAPCGYQYGGYSASGGGFWNGTSNVNGVLSVKQTPTVVANPVSGCAGTSIALNGTSSITGGTGSYSPTSPYTNTTPGTYTYTYSYSVNGCTTTSSPGSITVNAYPTATANAVSGCAGTNITLNGTSNMTGGTESYSPASPYNNSTAGTYTYTYTYSKNGCSTTSAPGNITVNASTAITADPTDRTVCVGATPAPLSVSASGSGLTYEWFSNITNSNTGGTSVATTATYTPPSTSAGTTYYYAIVTGTCGSATSNTSTVVVNDYSTNTTTITACDSYYWSVNGATYTGSGEYSATVGCVTETLFLTINSSTSESEAVTACDTYTWSANGATYTTSGTYTSAGLNAAGCTHTKTLVLTINSSTSESEAVTACDTYTWSANGATYTTSGTYTSAGLNAGGCTHTKTLVLTINSSTSSVETVTSPTCGTYTWAVNSVTYTSSGTYTVTGTNAAGCVDTKTLVLTINPCESVVNLKLFIEGYLNGTTMRPVKLNQWDGVTPATAPAATDVETLTVKLHDATTLAVIATTTGMLHTDGTLQAVFTTAPSGSFFISVIGSNFIRTWSAAAQTVGNTPLTYDFSTAASQAAGSNMKSVGGIFTFYSGDLDADGFIDFPDYSAWETDFNSGAVGAYPTDLDGDAFVDFPDYSIWETNFNAGVTERQP